MIDARLALRRLLAAPGYAAAVILMLALAVSASVAMFSAVEAVLLKPLPMAAPSRVVIGWGTSVERNLPVVELSYRTVQDVADQTRTMARVAAVGSSSWPVVLDGVEQRVRLASTGVSTTFFDTLGVVPALGRAFRPDDDGATAVGAVIVSHRLWVTRFGADPTVVGSTIRLPRPHTIVGVAPEGFDFPSGTDMWTPAVPVLLESGARLRIDALADVGVFYLVGRLRDEASIDAARAELTTLAGQQRSGGGSFGSGIRLLPIVEYVLGPVHRALWVMFAAVLLLLLVAAANVSALIVSRVSHRSGELTTRLALGATRTDLVRPWIIETVVLCGAGGIGGLLVSTVFSRVLIVLGSGQVPRLATMSTSASVLVFAVIVTVGAALTSAIAPVRVACRVDRPGAPSRESPRSGAAAESRRLRTVLVVVQMALSVVLLVGALLVLRSFANLRRIDLGFVPDDVMAMTVEAPDRANRTGEWLTSLLQAIGGLQDVQAVGAVSQRPLSGPIGDDQWVLLEGQPDTPAARRQNPMLNRLAATPGYFETLRIPLVRGRLFEASDRIDAPLVALVSERTARQLWPHDDPIGKRILMPGSAAGARPQWRTVVGVVGDVRSRGLTDARLDVYDAALQSANSTYDFMVRSASPPAALQGAIQAEILRRAPRTVIDGVTAMRAVADATTAPWRFSGFVLACFAAVAFCVALVGVTGLVALDVTSRRRETAIRQALGAQRSSVLRAIVARTAWRAAVGLLLGLAIAASSTWLLRSLLFDVPALDPIVFSAVAVLVALVVAVACYVPARIGTTLTLVEVLRVD